MPIAPDQTDIGRQVLYRQYVGGPVEIGVITSFNDEYVFVRYGKDAHSKATDGAFLEFSSHRRADR